MVAALLAGGCTGPLRAPDVVPDTFRAPLRTTVIGAEVLAATGDTIWADFPARGPDGIAGNQVSLDGGRTWQRGVPYPEIGNVVASRGRIAFSGGDDGMAVPMTFAAEEPGRVETFQWEDDGRKLQAMGTAAALWTNGLLSTRDSTIRTRWPALPSGRSIYLFSADSVWLARIVEGAGIDQLSVAPVASGVGGPPIRLPHALSYAADQIGLRTLVSDVDGLSVCAITLPAGARSCIPVTSAASGASLHQAGAISVVKADGRGYLIEAGWVRPVALPQGTREWEAEGTGDPTRPLVRVVDADGVPRHDRIEADGSVVPAFSEARTQVGLDLLALTPTTVFGTSAAVSWRREIGAQGLGGEIGVDGLVLAASAGRVLVDRGSGAQCLDGDQLGPVLGARAEALSGPYVAVADAVLTVTGKSLRASHPQAVFGSLVVERSRASGAGYRIDVRDLAGREATVEVQLSAGEEELAPARLWGDWVGGTFASADSSSGRAVELRNWRTGAARTTPGDLLALGDGFAVVGRAQPDGADSLVAVDLTSGLETVLSPSTTGAVVAVDGSRVAFVDRTDLVVQSITGAGTSAPRLLGALTGGEASAKSPWTVALDVTKPIAAGMLTVRSSDGRVVRSVGAAASASGSVRGLSWDGRDAAGTRVTPGSYTWEYDAQAADGTGSLRDVTGQHAPGGTIRVR